MAHNFRKLEVYSEALEIAKKTYRLSSNFPIEEKYGLKSQVQRAAVSIPSNIAEGSSRSSKKEFAHFLSISLGSAYELETQLLICKEFNFFNVEDFETFLSELIKLQKRIMSFKNKIEQG